MKMTKRGLMQVVALAAAARFLPTTRVHAQESQPAPDSVPFSFDDVVAKAKALAEAAYVPHPHDVPQKYLDLTYDDYRAIWFRPEAAIWAGQPTDFRLDLFHPGFIFNEPVTISLVEDGHATEIPFSTELFEYGNMERPPTEPGMGFAGFRVRYPINTPAAYQEFVVFLGASYFRAVGRNQVYGLSARGLAVDTAEPTGEEFARFTAFWIEQPAAGDGTVVVHALLDSRSVAGAYRFAIMPGAETVMETRVELFFRNGVTKVGIAPLTSMFQFAGMNRSMFNDYRRAVHDSDGLQILTGTGEWLWRPLSNPAELQVSGFSDRQPQGFGLMQRARRFEDFLDAEAKYEQRPELWIEPVGDWGEGAIELVEIPTQNEFNDNIVAYWRPDARPDTGTQWSIAYRMRWTQDVLPPPEMLFVAGSYAGQHFGQDKLIFVIDFSSANGAGATPGEGIEVEVAASAGQVSNPVIHDGHPNDALRVSFELDPAGATLTELRLRLTRAGAAISETWLYRWTEA